MDVFCKSKLISFASDSCIKGSVYKVSLVARLVFGKDVNSALRVLDFCKRRAAQDVRKVIRAALANAQHNKGFADLGKLYVMDISVGKAMSLKRFRARARGRGSRVIKSYSRVLVKLGAVAV